MAAAALAAPVLKTGDLCVEIAPSFENGVGEPGTTNAARPAWGLEYEITDAVDTYTGYLLPDTGCLDDYPVFAELSGGVLRMRVFTRARLRGIDLASWLGADWREPGRFAAVDFVVSTGTETSFSATSTVTSADQRWRNLALATGILRTLDGPGGTVHLQASPSVPADSCRSRLRDRDDLLGNEPIGLSTGIDAPIRSRLVETLRQVRAGLRRGHPRRAGQGYR